MNTHISVPNSVNGDLPEYLFRNAEIGNITKEILSIQTLFSRQFMLLLQNLGIRDMERIRAFEQVRPLKKIRSLGIHPETGDHFFSQDIASFQKPIEIQEAEKTFLQLLFQLMKEEEEIARKNHPIADLGLKHSFMYLAEHPERYEAYLETINTKLQRILESQKEKLPEEQSKALEAEANAHISRLQELFACRIQVIRIQHTPSLLAKLKDRIRSSSLFASLQKLPYTQ